MTNPTPLVSIITAVYNSEKYIAGCIRSVLAQSYPSVEHIIIDGGSVDNTVTIIKQYQDQLTYWISEPDKGIYDAWNKGLAVAKGDWIVFIGSDDVLEPNALQTYVDHITHHPRHEELEFVSSLIQLVDKDLTAVTVVGAPWKWEDFRQHMTTWHVSSFHARSLFEKYGVFNTHYMICGDYEFLLRPKDRLIASFVNKVTVRMRLGGISNENVYQAIAEIAYAKKSLGLISPMEGTIQQYLNWAKVFIRKNITRKKMY